MSMSALQAQLAALNGSSGKHAGSIVATSRRQEDSLGRGLHFRSSQGHAITETIHFKASFVYPSAKEAAKVPLRTLQDNAKEAAVNLSNMEPAMAGSLNALFGTEDASDETLSKLLIHISTLLGEKDDAVVENCLHVVEYLLRRYKVHLTTSGDLWQDLLWCFLPHHGQRASLVHRCLQLVDMASTANQSYLFLRPYSDPKKPVPVPRSRIAQHIMKNINLLRHVCHMVQEATTWINPVEDNSDSEDEKVDARYGLGYFFSWTAACVVEGLAWQRKSRDITDDDRESILRVLVPCVRHACASAQDAQSWGYIVASAAAETMELGDAVLNVWTLAILENGVDNAAAWSALLSLLVPPQTGSSYVDKECFMPLVNGKWVGCPLPKQTYTLATQSSDVARILGYLHQDLLVAPLLVAFFVRSIKSGNIPLVLSLLKEPTLESLWREPGLEMISSASAWIATEAASAADYKDVDFSMVLKNLHQMDPVAAEDGLALALYKTQQNQRFGGVQDDNEMESDGGRRMIEILEHVVAAPLRSGGGDVALPPRVAMDHADSTIRLNSIANLMKNASRKDSDGKSFSISLVDTFVSRWAQEQDFGVAKALVEAICKVLAGEFSDVALQVNAHLVFSGLYRWIESKRSDAAFVVHAIQMVRAAFIHTKFEADAREKQLALEVCVANLFHPDKHVAQTAHSALLSVSSSSLPGDSIRMEDAALAVMEAGSNFLQNIILGMTAGSDQYELSIPAELYTRQECAYSLLQLFGETKHIPDGNEEYAYLCLNLAVTLISLTTRQSSLTDRQGSAIVGCFKTCSSALAGPSHLFSSISILGSVSGQNYEDISVPIIKSILQKANDSEGRNIYPASALLEAALSGDCGVEGACRLIDLAAEYSCEGSAPAASLLGIVPVLSMLEHEDGRIRAGAVAFLKKIGEKYYKSKEWSSCGELSNMQTIYRDVFMKLDGKDNYQSLRPILSSIGTSDHFSFLRLCALTSSASETQTDSLDGQNALRSPGSSPFTLESASMVLQCMEGLGETAFPLMDRWERVGNALTEALLACSEARDLDSFQSLPDRVVSMLKGRYLMNESTHATSGPRVGGTGGRSRAYSIGSSDGARTIEPYPRPMIEALMTILGSKAPGADRLSSLIVTKVFLDKHWIEDVFTKFELSTRVGMFESILELVDTFSDKAASVFGQLPFGGRDVHGVLRLLMKTQPMKLPSIVAIARFASANSEVIGGSDDFVMILEVLFEVLGKLSSKPGGYDESDFEFTCQSLVSTIDVLCTSSTCLTAPPERVEKYFPLLLAYQGVSSKHFFSSKKYRLSALNLTATLAEKYPAHGLQALHDSFKSTLEHGSLITLGSKHRIEFISKIKGVFWQHSAHMAFVNILRTVGTYLSREDTNEALASDLILAFSKQPAPESKSSLHFSCPGALTGVIIAMEESQAVIDGTFDTAKEIIRLAPRKAKMPSLALLFQYTSNLAAELMGDHDAVEEIDDHLPSHKALIAIVEESRTTKAEASKLSLLQFTLHLVRSLQECLQLSEVQKMISKGSGEDARCALSLWQGSLWLHAVSQSIDSPDSQELDLWLSIAGCVGDIRDDLQLVLPVSLFLASVSSLLEEDKRSSTLCQALSLVADRVLEIHISSPEASLFLGLVPDLCAILGEESWKQETTMSEQSALLAIEHIGRMVAYGGESETTDASLVTPFVRAVEKIALVLDKGHHEVNTNNVAFKDIQQQHKDLISSIALTLVTLIRLVGVRSMPHLGMIFLPLIEALSSANKAIDARSSTEVSPEPRDMQMSIVRALSSIADHVPQFLGLHVGRIMKSTLLLSPSIRRTSDPLLKQAVHNFDTALATKVPARVLVPSLARVISTSCSADDLQVLLRLLQTSIDIVSPREASALKSSVFSCVTKALESEAALKSEVRSQATSTLVSFVLKLSESQLRRLFSALREWKSADDPTPSESNASRREAFWAISATLAEQLQALFLPCLSQVVDDVVEELEHAVSVLCKAESVLSGSSRKKRKLMSGVSYPQCTRVLQQVLLVLEKSLRADGREGGGWTRFEEGKRYNLLLEPISKLFHCIPSSESDASYSLYTDLVEGSEEEDEGNVVGCLTALAVAAGDEQLWKPLNHAVLEAAGTDGRSEVRHAGLVCLLSLMKTLGEEYMVLVPECLPVLSELMEDSNEEIGGLARDIVSLAEEVTGENLEDTLTG